MAKRMVVYHVNENRGCLYHCLRGFGILLAIGLMAEALGYIAAAAVGIGLWFLMRVIWRSMVAEMPENGFVRWGLCQAPIMRKVLAGIACVLLSVVLMASWGSRPRSSTVEGGQPATSKTVSEAGAAEEAKEEYEANRVATDDAINDFIHEYNAYSPSPFTDVRPGNIRIKTFARTYDHYCELLSGLDSAGMLTVTINADYDHQEMDTIREAFHDVVAVADPTLSDDEIYAAWDAELSGDVHAIDVTVGERVSYRFYPTVTTTSSPSFGRVEVMFPFADSQAE